MKELTIHQRLLLLVGLISGCMLFIQCPKTCSHSNLSPTQSQQSNKQKKSKKTLLHVRQLASRSAPYVEIIVQPSNTGIELSRCTIIASTLVGHGRLLAAVDKVKGRLQYNMSLTEETNLDKVYVSKGAAELFKQGKPIRVRCMYQPSVSSQPGEQHQVQIKVCEYDSGHRIVEQKAEQVSFLMAKNPKTEKLIKKPSSHVSKQGSQFNKKGRANLPEDRPTQSE